MGCCKKCSAFCGILVLLFGILFLLRDLNVWNFWNINWWTIAFILAGFGSFCATRCADCCSVSGWEGKCCSGGECCETKEAPAMEMKAAPAAAKKKQ